MDEFDVFFVIYNDCGTTSIAVSASRAIGHGFQTSQSQPSGSAIRNGTTGTIRERAASAAPCCPGPFMAAPIPSSGRGVRGFRGDAPGP